MKKENAPLWSMSRSSPRKMFSATLCVTTQTLYAPETRSGPTSARLNASAAVLPLS